MKVVVIGATGTIGKLVKANLEKAGHEVVSVGKTSGDFQVNIEDAASVRELYKKIGSFDAVVNAAGDLAFAPLDKITHAQWMTAINSKLLGQVNLVQQAIPFINEKGSFTLVSGVVSEYPIAHGAVATVVNRAVEGYVQAAACELPKGLRINVVSPTLLEESAAAYSPFFPGYTPVPGKLVAQAYEKSVLGIQTGQIFKLH
ncbi:short chain dehydrogenase [Bdellovibrio sp. NC01]|uniref:short chain dehydrogenase n=1 Tax=Bdellovibrio sp. NC01 TaxID=2220073 RepID=UPI00115C387A|nr:short chain dehydrogenase [Bdellovibrio sp. NC01]QDK36525.1 short chain dehydrogenase [Bdellovibrio sp. NC01]